jgi:hypothetical protein
MSLYPFAGAHAVKSAAFAFEWPAHLTESDFSRVQEAHGQLLSSLPEKSVTPALMIDMSRGTPMTANAIGSVNFSRRGVGGSAPSRALEVARDKCVAQINEYTRWEPVWNEVRGWFSVIAPLVVTAHPIKHIGLQYTDVFHWRADPGELNLRKVFRPSTKFLPPHVFDLKNLWHSHHGYFLEVADSRRHRLLENVNVNIIDELGQRTIVIQTLHKAEFATPLFNVEEVMAVMDQTVPTLHQRNKAALGDLLCDEVVEQIKLFKKAREA